MRLKCKACDATIKAKQRFWGKAVNCPGCGETLTIPAVARKPAAAAVKPIVVDDPAEPIFDEETPAPAKPAGRKPSKGFDEIDDYDDFGTGEFDDYGEAAPAPRPRKKARKPARSTRRSREPKSDRLFSLNGGVIGGMLMMIIALVWFFAGLAGGIIFFYPPILFVIGIAAFVKGIVG